MKLFYSSRSPYVRFVMIAAHEAGVQDRLELDPTLVNIEAPHPVLFDHNPLCKIPTLLLDDGSAIFDSRVIAEYLDSIGGGSLLPQTSPPRLTELRRTALGIGLVDLLLSWLLERNRPEAKQQPAIIAALGLKYAKVLDELEALAKQLASEPFRMGHVAIGTALSYSDFRFPALDWRAGRPALAAWHQSFEARPSYQSDPFFDEIAAAAIAAQAAEQPAR
tara:strand:+ start:35337 stop:35996 length:660 start_codon:yes stop_codon:yes gene_type:complete